MFANSGNYKGFGDTKFVPNLSKEAFEKVVKASKAYESDNTHMTKLWQNTEKAIYSLTPRLTSLGLADKVCIVLVLIIYSGQNGIIKLKKNLHRVFLTFALCFIVHFIAITNH